MSKRLAGKTALITGSGKGLGAQTAKSMAQEGATVIITDIEDATPLAEEINASQGKAFFLSLDVTDETNWQTVMKSVEDTHGGLDILVNNAGIAPTGHALKDQTLERWRHVMAINLDGVFLGCKYAIASMEKKGKGSIVNISSIAGLVGMARAGEYNAAKGAVRLLTKTAALECAEMDGTIRVNSIHPGFVPTDLVLGALRDNGTPQAEEKEALKLIAESHPLKRLGTPSEIAAAVVFLASDDASFITGAELAVDGGYTAQ